MHTIEMATVREVIKMECDQITNSRERKLQQQLTESVTMILDQAREIVEKRSSYGEEATTELLSACEESMKSLVQTGAKQRAMFQALQTVSNRAADDWSPQDVQKAYESAATEEVPTGESLYSTAEPFMQLREIITGADGASGSGVGLSQAAGEDLGEEGFSMTQAKRSLKCTLTFQDMQPTGELRPMKGPCGHVFSFKGLQMTLKNKTMKCPQMGCNRQVSLHEFVDAKDVVKEIRSAHRHQAMEAD